MTQPGLTDAKSSSASTCWKGLLASWDLSQFGSIFKENGFTDPIDWIYIDENDLSEMGFKKGHKLRFNRKLKELVTKQSESMPSKHNDNTSKKTYKREYFEKCGNGLVIKGQQNDTITRQSGCGYNTVAFGANWIPSNASNIVKWTVKLIEPEQHSIVNYGVIIGIVSKDVSVNNCCIYGNKDALPSYFCVTHPNMTYNGSRNFDPKIGGTVFVMELNLQKQQLIYHIESGEYTVVINDIFKDDSIKYKLALSMHHKDTTLKIINFEYN
eukprot:78236_1